MDLANDFEFKPLPPIVDETTAAFSMAETAAAAPNPRGRLAALAGTWKGTGFNVIWRPNSVPGQDRFLQLNVTTETLAFEEIDGPIPNRGLLQGDINMFGLTYLQQISDRNLNAGLHIEPGVWARVPQTTNPAVKATLVRMASIPHGTTIVAQGISSTTAGAPVIPKGGIKPFVIGDPTSTIDFVEQDLSKPAEFRTPKEGLVGVTQAMVNDPNTVLKSAISGQNITSTDVISVSTSHQPILGGGTANTAFLEGGPDGPNAVASVVTSTFFIETVKGTPDFLQLQYTQTVLLDFDEVSWPHITVGTLRRV